MTIEELLDFMEGDLIAMDGKDGKILFDTTRHKTNTIEKYSSGRVMLLWSDVRLCKGVAFGDYFKPVMKCYVLHDSWKKQEVTPNE